jgi:hypothetical protein
VNGPGRVRDGEPRKETGAGDVDYVVGSSAEGAVERPARQLGLFRVRARVRVGKKIDDGDARGRTRCTGQVASRPGGPREGHHERDWGGEIGIRPTVDVRAIPDRRHR